MQVPKSAETQSVWEPWGCPLKRTIISACSRAHYNLDFNDLKSFWTKAKIILWKRSDSKRPQAILLVERGITPPLQTIRMRAANAFETRTFTNWPEKRNDLERAIHYFAALSDNNLRSTKGTKPYQDILVHWVMTKKKTNLAITPFHQLENVTSLRNKPNETIDYTCTVWLFYQTLYFIYSRYTILLRELVKQNM